MTLNARLPQVILKISKSSFNNASLSKVKMLRARVFSKTIQERLLINFIHQGRNIKISCSVIYNNLLMISNIKQILHLKNKKVKIKL